MLARGSCTIGTRRRNADEGRTARRRNGRRSSWWSAAIVAIALACTLGVGLAAARAAARGPNHIRGRAAASVHADTSEETKTICTDAPGTGPPPEKLGPYTMTEFQGGGPEGLDETPNVDTYIPETQINSPAGVLKFSETLDGKNDVSYAPPEYNWLTWSNGYEGEVWWNGNGNNGETSYFPEYPPEGIGIVPLLSTPRTMTITLPPDVRAFYAYVEPYPDSIPWLGDTAAVSMSAPHEGEVGPITVQGFHGAAYFGCYNEAGLSSVSVSSNSPVGFAIGELGIAAVKYVAMGDSFSSGEGVPPFTDGTACHRSELAYPELLERGVLKKLPLGFVACSGATTVTGQNQFKSLSKSTKVVTVTFGGDDIGFAEILKACITRGCQIAMEEGVAAVQNLPQRIAALKSTLVSTYKEIFADAPNAAVYVLGYPYLFPPHPGKLQFCLKKGFLFPIDLADLASWETQLDEVIRQAVAATGGKITYVEPNNLFAGHDVCSESSWFNAIGSWFKNGHHLEYLFHPTAEGQAALEEALVEAGIGSHANDSRKNHTRLVLSHPTAHVPAKAAPRQQRTDASARLRGAERERALRNRRLRLRHSSLDRIFAPLVGNTPFAVKADAEEASGAISGRVTDALSGEGLPDICVYAFGYHFERGGFGWAETEADGDYTIESGLPSGTYQVEFWPCERSEYVGQYYDDDEASYEQATPVEVTDGQTTPNIDAALAKSGTISGKVTAAATGEGLEGVCVTASSTDYGIGGGRATTGPEGTYSISTDLTAGSYHVEFDPTCSGSTPSSFLVQFYNGAISERSANDVDVAAGTATTEVDAALQQSATISGRVTSVESGEGLGGVCVSATSTDSGAGRGSTRTASDGTYTISDGLYTDSYRIDFDPSCERFGSSPYLSEYFAGAERASAAAPVSATAGQTSAGIDASLQTSAKISGTVTEATSGSPIAGVCVTATPTGTGVGTGSARTAGNGTYTISTGLSTGSYAVEFDPSCEHEFSQSFAGQFYDEVATVSGATLVSATAEATVSGINAALKAPGTLTGTVTDAAHGSPLSDVCVDASSDGAGSGYESVSTDSEGAYSITGLPAGSYKVEFVPGCGGTSEYATQLYGEEDGRPPVSVTISSGATTAGVNAALGLSGTISGTVTDGGTPQEGVCVDVSSIEGPDSPSTTTAANGTYTVAGLQPGTYTVEFDPSCGGFTNAADLPQFYEGAAAPGEAKPVSVGAGATIGGVDAELQPAGSISGTVTDGASGSPMAGVCVTASPDTNGAADRTASTAADGTYTVHGLAAGNYTVEFDPTCNGTVASADAAEFYESAESQTTATPVAVTSGAGTSAVDAALQKPGEITGNVTDAATGAPVAGVCVEVLSSDNGPGSGYTITAADGSYSVPELPADSYVVQFEPACQGTEQTSFERERYSQSVAVAAGQTRTGIDGALSTAKSGKVETTTKLHLSEDEATYGNEQTEQISATVLSADRVEPTGSVKVSAGSKTVCTIKVSEGGGTCPLKAKKLKAGSYGVRATYKGSKGFAGSASASSTLVIDP